MSRITFVALLALLHGITTWAQSGITYRAPTTGQSLADFIPIGYDTLSRGYATGDLNGDNRPDVVLALGHVNEDTASQSGAPMPARQLLVLFRTATGYTLAAQSSQAVLCKDCGGMYGDPFAGLSIKKGVLSLHHYGGSRWRWGITAKFRYLGQCFYLIGQTTDYGTNGGNCDGLNGPPGWEYHDINFVTGEYETATISEACKLLVHKRGKRKPVPLQKLAAYKAQP